MKLNWKHSLLFLLNRYFLIGFVFMLGTGVYRPVNAQSDSVKGRNVDTRIISNWADRQDNSFLVAILFEINDGWHTYWKNPGTTGMSTQVHWSLPEGMKIKNAYQSIPHLYSNQGLVDYVHENSAMVIASVEVDSNIKSFQDKPILATVEWLECSTLCVPGQSKLSLNLNENVRFTDSQKSKIDQLLSLYQSNQTGYMESTGGTVRFEFPLNLDEIGSLSSAYFFPELPITDAAGEQVVRIVDGNVTISSQPSPYEQTETSNVSGWLQLDLENGESHTIRYQLSTANGTDTSLGKEVTATPASSNLFILIALAFIGGMILNLMPCVFPVIGLKIMGFVEQAGEDHRKIALHGLIFTAGVLASFWVLSALLLLLRAGGEQLGWGFQLQEPWFNYGLILLMLAFALSLNGVFEFGMSAVGVGSGLQQKSGIMGSFFSGVLATVVATPCSAPFLAPALGAALSLASWQAMILFTFIALGLSTPYLLLSIFPGTLKFLPRPGPWMETFKQFMAFPLYGTVGYLLWSLLGQIDDSNQLNLLLSLALFAMAFWIYGRWAAPHKKRRTRYTAVAIGIIAVVISIWMGHPKQQKAFWEKWSPETVAKYVEQGKTVYVDFTARWCATCQLNKRIVFSSEEVQYAFENPNVVALKADWTNRDEAITKRLKSLGKAAVPVNLVYKHGEHKPIILPEVLTPGIVLEAIQSE